VLLDAGQDEVMVLDDTAIRGAQRITATLAPSPATRSMSITFAWTKGSRAELVLGADHKLSLWHCRKTCSDVARANAPPPASPGASRTISVELRPGRVSVAVDGLAALDAAWPESIDGRWGIGAAGGHVVLRSATASAPPAEVAAEDPGM
jgi:hypothetical protein